MVWRLRAETRVLVMAVVLLTILCLPVLGRTIYVNCTRPDDTSDGLSWAMAKKTVQAGIDAAASGDEVWVAKGVYVERIALSDGVALYGGFAGAEMRLSDRVPFLRRSPDPNETILDGDQGGSVAMIVNCPSALTRIDGFSIRDGSAACGGGISCDRSSPTITNNTITANTSVTRGGGVLCQNNSSPLIYCNLITGNSASRGGGVSILACTGTRLVGNVISANVCHSRGAGLAVEWDDDFAAYNNTIVANRCTYGGSAYGAIFVRWASTAVLAGNIIAFNNQGVYRDEDPTLVLRNNCVFGNEWFNYAGCSAGPGDISADPLFESVAGADYRLRPGSPCIDAGDNSALFPGELDMDGMRRLQGSHVDIGAYEFPAEGGTGALYARFQAPAAVRPGREYVAWVHYGNSGSADLPLPLLNLSNSAGVLMRIGQEGRTSTTGLALLGVSPTGAPTLPPGAEASIPITFTAPASGSVEFSLTALQGDSEPVNWSALEPILRPEGIAANDPGWLSFWASSTAQLGSTWREILDKTAALASGTNAPFESRVDFTGVLGYALTLGENLAGAANQCDPAAYDAQSDVRVYEVDQPFDCLKNCTYVVSHGWNGSSMDADIANLSHAVKDHCPQCNVLQVDWSGGARTTLPWCAASHIGAAAIEADNKIKAKIEQRWNCAGQSSSFDWSTVTYVGHSFGNSINSRIASFHGRRGKAVILHPPSVLGGGNPNYDDDFVGGSISVSTGGLADANPCLSPRIAGTNVKLTDYVPDFNDPLAHGTALRCLTEQLENAGGSCDNQVLRGDWSTSTQRPGWYDGSLPCDGTPSMSPSRPPCADSMLPPGVRVALALIRVVMPVDPNEKTGPEGEGPDKLVSALDELEYTVYFENAPEATAPVQEAIITDDLSISLDWSTFQLQEIAFGDKIVPIDGASSYTGSVDIPNLRVDMTASVNTLTGRAQWILRAIDPVTGLPPVDPLVGFLPPNDPATHSGEAHVRFKIRPKADTPVGMVISNVASIVFDQMSPTLTPSISNTIGAFPPGTVGSPSPADGATDVAINTSLSWSSANRTTSYDLYLRRDGQPKPVTPTAAGWPATGYQPMADFAVATTYRWHVVAKNPAGETPGPEWTFTTAPLPPVTYARSLGNGQAVAISRTVVSAAFADSFYLEADDRSSGIRVERAGHGLSVGMRAEVTGTAKTNVDGERCIEATWATKNGTGWVNPIGMNRKFLGGLDFLFNGSTGAGQQGVLDGFGLNNIGLLVKLWGRVTEVEPASPPMWFTLDDGTGPGVRCIIPAGVTINPAWQMISVTGISSCEKVGEELHRLLRVRQQSDIVCHL